jgi:hypothetical protein
VGIQLAHWAQYIGDALLRYAAASKLRRLSEEKAAMVYDDVLLPGSYASEKIAARTWAYLNMPGNISSLEPDTHIVGRCIGRTTRRKWAIGVESCSYWLSIRAARSR